MNKAECTQIIGIMKSGGYYSNIMNRGPEFNRVKEFLQILAGDRNPPTRHPMQNPDYPCFPGLTHHPFRNCAEFPAVAVLESNFATILEEAVALGSDSYLDYTGVNKYLRFSLDIASRLIPKLPRINWSLYPFFHMGVDVESVIGRCPKTAEIIRSLDGSCLEYPWGDAIFSVQQPRSGLPPHCSVDNFRVRCHLGLDIPPHNGIRVAKQTRHWEPGRCLVFEDSFVHEVWNRSNKPRLVLIVDFWHPDLTSVERMALTAGFRHSRVRRIFANRRRNLTSAPERYAKIVDASPNQRQCKLACSFPERS